MGDLLAIVPTRGRPHNIERLWAAIEATADTPVDMLCVLDDDDPIDYPRIDGVHYLTTPRLRLAGSYNAALEHIKGWPHTHLALWNDDHVPETQHWDTILMEACGPVGFAYGLGCSGMIHADQGDFGVPDSTPTSPPASLVDRVTPSASAVIFSFAKSSLSAAAAVLTTSTYE